MKREVPNGNPGGNVYMSNVMIVTWIYSVPGPINNRYTMIKNRHTKSLAQRAYDTTLYDAYAHQEQ
jgi:rRNA processing protein Gar1